MHGERSGDLAISGLLSVSQPRNGLTLCQPCHQQFDAGLWFIEPGDRETVIASQALLEYDPAWRSRKAVRTSLKSMPNEWPPTETLQVQAEFVRARQRARSMERKEKPFRCDKCGKSGKTAVFLTRHGCIGRVLPHRFHTNKKAKLKRPATVAVAASSSSTVRRPTAATTAKAAATRQSQTRPATDQPTAATTAKATATRQTRSATAQPKPMKF